MEIASALVGCEWWWLGKAGKMKCAGGKSKRPWTFKLLIITPTHRIRGIWVCLNIPINMQVSVQVGGSQLSLWFAFCKQHVRDGGKDGEQSDFLIISTVSQNTVLIEESLQMRLSVKGRIFEAALFITPDLRTQLRKWISITRCLKKEPFVRWSGFKTFFGCICYTFCFFEREKKRKFQLDRDTAVVLTWQVLSGFWSSKLLSWYHCSVQELFMVLFSTLYPLLVLLPHALLG